MKVQIPLQHTELSSPSFLINSMLPNRSVAFLSRQTRRVWDVSKCCRGLMSVSHCFCSLKTRPSPCGFQSRGAASVWSSSCRLVGLRWLEANVNMGALLSSRERHDCVGYDECARRLEYPHPRSQPKMSERVDLHDACHGPQQAPQSAQQAPPPASALETSSSSCVGNGAPTSTTDCSPAPKKSTKKRVRWSTITIHEFGVGHGGSAVPKNGPSIGLAQTPEFTWSTKVGTMARSLDGVRRFSATERVALLRSAGYAVETIKSFVEEAAHERNSRELYHSHVMKLFRKKRKKRKLSKNHEETSVVTTPTNSVSTIASMDQLAGEGLIALTVGDQLRRKECGNIDGKGGIANCTASSLSGRQPLSPVICEQVAQIQPLLHSHPPPGCCS